MPKISNHERWNCCHLSLLLTGCRMRRAWCRQRRGKRVARRHGTPEQPEPKPGSAPKAHSPFAPLQQTGFNYSVWAPLHRLFYRTFAASKNKA